MPLVDTLQRPCAANHCMQLSPHNPPGVWGGYASTKRTVVQACPFHCAKGVLLCSIPTFQDVAILPLQTNLLHQRAMTPILA